MSENAVIFFSDEFYISYVARRSDLAKLLDAIVAVGMGNDEPPERDETALCIKTDQKGIWTYKFYILYGDHREAYRALVPDCAACVRYFLANLDKIAHSSDRPTEETVQ
jgi:hypothetical protein